MANAGTMDFFGHQDNARKKTSILVFYYVLAVIFIIVAVYLAVTLVIFGAQLKMQNTGQLDLTRLWKPDVFLFVLIGTAIIVITGTLYKIAQLGKGGEAVARMLGGRKVQSNTTDPAERRFFNVVEEMAIASGTPVASVYVLDDEPGINAFAAGFSPSDAVIAATRGCIETLSRDELQGVVAHEFSHILNGDMRLNIRLTGVLHGILLISLVGYWIMRSGGSGSSRSKKGGGQIVFLGLLLWIIGYIGIFFGKLIKSAVSRQREFLADASAVQFTRNPDGIAGALKRIGGYSQGSRIRSSNAEQASHFFFANGLTSSLMSAFATHPPLTERIRRIDPSFKGAQKQGAAHAGSSAASGMAAGFAGGSAKIAVNTDDVVATVGQPGQNHIAYASKLLSSIPENIDNALRDPASACAVIFCLLLSDSEKVRSSQLDHLNRHADPASLEYVESLHDQLAKLGPEYRIPLADVAVSALKEMSPPQYKIFIDNIDWLTAADEELDLFEYALKALVKRRLEPVFGQVDKLPIQFYDLKPLTAEVCRLMSCIAYWGADTMEEATKAFIAGMAKAGLVGQQLVGVDQCGLDMVDKAINKLNLSSPFVKKRVVQGCVECVALDGNITVDEAELVRAIADGLGCPVPPLAAGPLDDAA